MNDEQLERHGFRWTPGRAVRRPSSRSVLLYLVKHEGTFADIRNATGVNERYLYRMLNELVRINFVEKLTEEGTRPAYNITPRAREYMRQRGYLNG